MIVQVNCKLVNIHTRGYEPPCRELTNPFTSHWLLSLCIAAPLLPGGQHRPKFRGEILLVDRLGRVHCRRHLLELELLLQ